MYFILIGVVIVNRLSNYLPSTVSVVQAQISYVYEGTFYKLGEDMQLFDFAKLLLPAYTNASRRNNLCLQNASSVGRARHSLEAYVAFTSPQLRTEPEANYNKL